MSPLSQSLYRRDAGIPCAASVHTVTLVPPAYARHARIPPTHGENSHLAPVKKEQRIVGGRVQFDFDDPAVTAPTGRVWDAVGWVYCGGTRGETGAAARVPRAVG